MPSGPDGVHVRAVFEFSKYSGAGNDFVIARADDRSDPIGAELARRVCSRRTGVGVDGLILVYLRPDGIRVRFFNPDGSEFSTCGNGSRCAARFASDEGLGDPAGFVLAQREVGCGEAGRLEIALAAPHGACIVLCASLSGSVKQATAAVRRAAAKIARRR